WYTTQLVPATSTVPVGNTAEWIVATSFSSSALLWVRLRYMPVGLMYPTVDLVALSRWPVDGSVRPFSMPARSPELGRQPDGSAGSRIGKPSVVASACKAATAS